MGKLIEYNDSTYSGSYYSSLVRSIITVVVLFIFMLICSYVYISRANNFVDRIPSVVVFIFSFVVILYNFYLHKLEKRIIKKIQILGENLTVITYRGKAHSFTSLDITHVSELNHSWVYKQTPFSYTLDSRGKEEYCTDRGLELMLATGASLIITPNMGGYDEVVSKIKCDKQSAPQLISDKPMRYVDRELEKISNTLRINLFSKGLCLFLLINLFILAEVEYMYPGFQNKLAFNISAVLVTALLNLIGIYVFKRQLTMISTMVKAVRVTTDTIIITTLLDKTFECELSLVTLFQNLKDDSFDITSDIHSNVNANQGFDILCPNEQLCRVLPSMTGLSNLLEAMLECGAILKVEK